MSKKILEVEEWKEITKKLNIAYNHFMELGIILRKLPKTKWFDKHERVLNRIGEYRSDMEDMMFTHHPDHPEINTQIFYEANQYQDKESGSD